MNEADLQRLRDNRVAEGRLIDYKVALPAKWNDEAKREFLADVSSFANESGGSLYFGIREEGGIAVDLVGVQVEDRDKLVQLIENLLRDGLEERLPGYAIEWIPLSSGLPVLALHIRRSWVGPHRVKFNRHDAFYGRTNAGKYPLDVRELRRAFVASEEAVDRLRRFRRERLAIIRAGETIIGPPKYGIVVVHLLPLTSAWQEAAIDVASAEGLAYRLQHMNVVRGANFRHNLDGVMKYELADDFGSYVQLFRSGAVELADAGILSPPPLTGATHRVPPTLLEREVANGVGHHLELLRQLDVALPINVVVSLLNVAGYSFLSSYALDRTGGAMKIDRPDVLTPELLVESFEQDPFALLRPLFDVIWNAAGWERSLSYSAEGEWRELSS